MKLKRREANPTVKRTIEEYQRNAKGRNKSAICSRYLRKKILRKCIREEKEKTQQTEGKIKGKEEKKP